LSVFNTMASYYDSWYKNDGKLIFETEVKALQEIMQHTPTGPFIEIGIGSGRFAQALNIEFGIDPAIELLKIAGKRQINVLQGIGELLPFKNCCFGTVFIISTLCFVSSVSEVFGEANRILKNEGALILGTIPSTGSWGKYYEEKKQADHPFYRNATFYSPNQIKASLEAAGFSIIDMISTLMQQPDRVSMVESPQHIFTQECGFITILAKKPREGQVV
jgi:ubiquinone/menaquinone biosynthesis C-methylase UbiE